jgi:hypothetical protein
MYTDSRTALPVEFHFSIVTKSVESQLESYIEIHTVSSFVQFFMSIFQLLTLGRGIIHDQTLPLVHKRM